MAQSGLAGQRSQLHKFENGLRVAAGCGLWHNLSIGKRIEQCGGATRALADAGCSNSKSAGHDIVAGALLLVGKATGLCRTYTTTLFKKLNEVPRWPMATGGRRYCLHLAQSDKPIVAIPAMATGGRWRLVAGVQNLHYKKGLLLFQLDATIGDGGSFNVTARHGQRTPPARIPKCECVRTASSGL